MLKKLQENFLWNQKNFLELCSQGWYFFYLCYLMTVSELKVFMNISYIQEKFGTFQKLTHFGHISSFFLRKYVQW